uniref:Uncharacterized protein n=1 Tax=viral metagenome TaxID=1070528 RepID=A0A6C0IDA0_9ZZZZ
MFSQRQFTPGKKSNSRKMINYTAERNTSNLNCVCVPDKYDKTTVGSDSPSLKISNNMRIAQVITSSLGGKTQYGNFYLGQPLQLNYLGRNEGMPGGSGSAPKNKFN